IARAKLGVIVDDRLGGQITQRMGVQGVLVLGVEENSGAAAAGLRPTQRLRNGRIIPGDVIQRVGETPVRSSEDLLVALSKYEPGQVVTLTLLRDGKSEQIEVKLDEGRD